VVSAKRATRNVGKLVGKLAEKLCLSTLPALDAIRATMACKVHDKLVLLQTRSSGVRGDDSFQRYDDLV
jgi:hypothetical protein